MEGPSTRGAPSSPADEPVVPRSIGLRHPAGRRSRQCVVAASAARSSTRPFGSPGVTVIVPSSSVGGQDIWFRGFRPTLPWRPGGFLRRAGALPREIFHDLLVDLALPLPTVSPRADLRLEPAPREAMLAFLTQDFPGEWESDVSDAYDAGATVLGLYHAETLVGFRSHSTRQGNGRLHRAYSGRRACPAQ
jgi:hypothetical protein